MEHKDILRYSLLSPINLTVLINATPAIVQGKN